MGRERYGEERVWGGEGMGRRGMGRRGCGEERVWGGEVWGGEGVSVERSGCCFARKMSCWATSVTT